MPLVFDRLCLVVNEEKTFFPFNNGSYLYPTPCSPWRSLPPGDEAAPEATEPSPAAKADPQAKPGAVSAPFSDHSREVVSAVGEFASRAEERLVARVKAGRELSAANRTEIDTVCTALESGVANSGRFSTARRPCSPTRPRRARR
jgi:hypothetical protein